MRVGALGPVEILAGPGVNLGGPKPRTLLAALLLEPGRVVSVDRLVDLIWDENPPQSAIPLVHTYVSALRRGLTSIGEQAMLSTRAPGYVLDVAAQDVDIEVFNRYFGEARLAEQASDSDTAAERYRQALALWRGPAFSGVDARFARTRAAALSDERLAAEEGLARCEMALGHLVSAVSRLSTLSATHPLREEARGLLMRALYLSGRQGDALAVYRDGRDQLISELGVEPSAALHELHLQILDGTVNAPVRPVITLPSRPEPVTTSAPNQLPPDIADFTGRAEQLEQMVTLARSPATTVRILLVSGFAGAGKSALAVHCAHTLTADYPDGQLFADLHGDGKPAETGEVLARLLRALGVSGADMPDNTDERAELYRMTVATRRLIIVLDNAHSEHDVRKLLPGTASSLVIITSRSLLTGIAGAHAITLDVLSTQQSVEMLSRIVGAGRVANEMDAARTISLLCGGIPLAIRVAGAKLLVRGHWPLRTLAIRLSDERRRLDELSVGDLAIRSSLKLTYDELEGPQRKALHLLSLVGLADFGSWTAAPLLDVGLDEAEDLVENLVDLRLLDIAGVDALGRVRYRFHDLVRLYGAEQGGEHEPAEHVAAAVTRLLEVWMALVDAGSAQLSRVTLGLRPVFPRTADLDPRLAGEVTSNPTEWLAAETSAVVRTVERAYDLGVGEPSTTLIAALLSSPFASRNEFDGWQRTLDVALKAAIRSQNRQAEAAMLAGLGQMFYERDDFATAIEHFQRALEVARPIGDAGIQAVALVGVGTVHRDRGDFAAARPCLAEAAGLARDNGDQQVLAAAMYGLSAIDRDHGDMAVAETELSHCVELYRQLGDVRGEALALRGLSLCRRAIGDVDSAAVLSQQALALLQDAGDALGAAYAQQSLAKARIRQGRHDGLSTVLASCLDVCRRYKDRFGAALITRTLGELALAGGDRAQATVLLEDALARWRELALPLWEARTLRDLAAAVPDGTEYRRMALSIFTELGAREAGELACQPPQRDQ
jgi:DNA-binding SARP family transcriptional activator/tetratricopeptide (TPR) repeat protein